MKNILVNFKCIMGDYEYTDFYIFNKKKSDWGYCKEFWGISKRDSSCLGSGAFWDDAMENAISVRSTQEITKQEAYVLTRLGVA